MAAHSRVGSSRFRSENKKPLRERSKDKKHGRLAKPVLPPKPATQNELTAGTLKRLHTLGNQRFGSSPFSQHFERWLLNVEAVLAEFEAHPDINVDAQFIQERQQTLATITLQLEERRQKEATLEQEVKNLADTKTHLKQLNTEYATQANALRAQKRSKLRRLYPEIEYLKQEQERVMRLKTGFFAGLSKKAKEQKEIAIAQELNEKEHALEMVLLEFNVAQKKLHEAYDQKREPIWNRIKVFKKNLDELESDGSLEERWFACEALIDSVNSFLQRRSAEPLGSSSVTS
jgi:hypothetical protein